MTDTHTLIILSLGFIILVIVILVRHLGKRPYTTTELEIADAILNYLSKKPQSRDTFEGIVDWWVMDREINRAVEKLAKGLDLLTSERLILVEENMGKKYYKINQEALAQIRKILGGNNRIAKRFASKPKIT
jgi:hypothetical protein